MWTVGLMLVAVADAAVRFAGDLPDRVDSNESVPLTVFDDSTECLLLSPRSRLSSVELALARRKKAAAAAAFVSAAKIAAQIAADTSETSREATVVSVGEGILRAHTAHSLSADEMAPILEESRRNVSRLQSILADANVAKLSSDVKKTVRLLVPSSHFSAEKVDGRRLKNRRRSIRRFRRILQRQLALLGELERQAKGQPCKKTKTPRDKRNGGRRKHGRRGKIRKSKAKGKTKKGKPSGRSRRKANGESRRNKKGNRRKRGKRKRRHSVKIRKRKRRSYSTISDKSVGNMISSTADTIIKND